MTCEIEIVEVSPRDGLQNDPTMLGTQSKVALIERTIDAGLRRIEAVSFVNPKLVPQMADAEAVMAAVPRDRNASYIGLALNERGAQRAVAAGVDEINYVVVATDTFGMRNQGATVDQGIAAWAPVARLAREAGIRTSVTIAAAFGCPFEQRVAPERVLEIAGRVAETETPDEIAIADTIGVGVPAGVRALAQGLTELLPGIPLRAHFHNTRNTGYANALAAVEAGITTLDASIGGIGGCTFAPNATGNIATEDLIYLLQSSGYETGADLEALNQTASWLEARLEHPVPGLLHRAGPFPAPGEAAQ